uniref:Protein grindelwald n=1 Tax=Anopheles farauti TaxID=69004 RepID=A0A182QBV2_9DIPT
MVRLVFRTRRAMLVPVLMLVAFSVAAESDCIGGCKVYQYCDGHRNSCRSCSELCAKDEDTCVIQCRDYLFKSLLTSMQRVSTLETISKFLVVAVVIVILALIGAGVIFAYRLRSRIVACFRARIKQEKSAPVGYTHENPNTKSPKAPPKNGANVPKPSSTTVSIYPETEADNSVQTGTTSISHRYPAEDSTESYSYDNTACNVTPTSNNPMPKF